MKKEQNSVKTGNNAQAQRVTNIHEVKIAAHPDEIFPLACPVEELKWIDNWAYDMVYSKSGVNENYCIFREDFSGPVLFDMPASTMWITSLHDPENHRIRFALVTGELSVINFEFEIPEFKDGISTCKFCFIFTSLDGAGNQPDTLIREKLETIQTFIGNSLKHYCETGDILKA